MSPSRRRQLVACGLVGLGVAAYAAHVARLWPFTVDDAFITLRYSRNLARGVGPVFNPTGTRSEGYTSASWMVVLALVQFVGANPVVGAKVLGVLAVLATSVVVAFWARAETRGSAWCSVAMGAAPAAYLSMVRTAVHAVSGMETALFGLLLTATSFAVSRFVADPESRPIWPAVGLGLLLGLTRPEGNVAVTCGFCVAAFAVPAVHRTRLASAFIVGQATPIAAYELARIRYYGLPFPLPFYVKLACSESLPGAPNVLEWFASTLRFAVPLGACLVRPSRSMLPALASCVALVVFFVFPQHLMGYDSRYLAPLDGTVCVLFGAGLTRLIEWRAPGGSRLRVSAAAALAALAGVWSMTADAASIDERVTYATGLSRAHVKLGRDLSALRVSSGRLALSDAGAVPFLSGWWTLDLLGLNTAEIALGSRRNPAWVLANRPDVIVLASQRRDQFLPWEWNAWEKDVLAAAQSARFTRVSVREFAPDYWLWVLARSGSRVERALAGEALPPVPPT